MSRLCILFLLVNVAASESEVPSRDGVTQDVMESLAKDIFSYALKGKHETRRLNEVVADIKTEGRRLTAAERRLDSQTDMGTGQSGGASGPTTGGMVKGVVVPQCQVKETPCITVEVDKQVCTELNTEFPTLNKEIPDATKTINKCFCEDCPDAGKFVEYVSTTINDVNRIQKTSNSRLDFEKKMQIKGVDEIAGMCTHYKATDCVFGGTKPSCESILSFIETNTQASGQPQCVPGFGAVVKTSDGTQRQKCVTERQALTNIMLPEYKCLCVECGYAEYAKKVSPIAKKLVQTKDMLPVMKEMSAMMCKEKETVKCFTGTKGTCGDSIDYILANAPDAQQAKVAAKSIDSGRKGFHKALDCLCSSCPDAIPKFLTMMEKVEKGEITTDAQRMEAMCDFYQDIDCFLKQDTCMDAVAMLLKGAEPALGGQAPISSQADFKAEAKKAQGEIKAECSKAGITVKEFTESSETSGAPVLRASLVTLAFLIAAYFMRA